MPTSPELSDAQLLEARDTLLRGIAAKKAACPIKYFSTGGRPSQTPFFYDKHPITAVVAGRGAGKTMAVRARTVMAMTGIEPLALPGSLALLPKPPIHIRDWCVDLTRVVDEVLLPLYWELIPPALLDLDHGRRGYNSEKHSIRLLTGTTAMFMSHELRKGAQEAAAVDINDFCEIPPERTYASQKARIFRRPLPYMWIEGTRAGQAMPWDVQWVDRRILRGGDGDAVSWHELDTMENLNAIAAEQGGTEEGIEAILLRQKQIIDSMTDEERAVVVGGLADWTPGIIYKTYCDALHTYDVEGMTADVFVGMAREGWGDIWCGMDYGGAHPTVVEYCYVAKRPLPEVQIVEGDWIVIHEYYRANANVVHHLPALQERQRKFRPRMYVCDPHMWDKRPVVAPAFLYAKPELLQRVETALGSARKLTDLTPIGPLRPGNNNVDTGIQMVSALLMPRAEPFPWPRLRILRGQAPWLRRGLLEWQRKADCELRVGEDKYTEHMKDPCDSLRYLVVAQPDRGNVPVGDYAPAVPVDPNTGIPLNYLTGLGGLA